MLIEDLIHQFILIKKREPSHSSELLRYIKKSYIYGELSAVEYKKLFLDLNLTSITRKERYSLSTSTNF